MPTKPSDDRPNATRLGKGARADGSCNGPMRHALFVLWAMLILSPGAVTAATPTGVMTVGVVITGAPVVKVGGAGASKRKQAVSPSASAARYSRECDDRSCRIQYFY